MFNIDFISTYVDYFIIGGKTYNLQQENPCSYGRKTLISHLSKIKKLQFTIFIYSNRSTSLQLHPILLKYLNSLGSITFFFGLSKAKVHYILVKPCQLIAVCL